MKPFTSIVLALLITILLFILDMAILVVFDTSLMFLHILIIFIGGGIATGLSTDNKVKYSLYYGIISAVIFGFIYNLLFYEYFMLFLTIITLLAVIGGFSAKKIREKGDKKTKLIVLTGIIGIVLVIIAVSTFTYIGDRIPASGSSTDVSVSPDAQTVQITTGNPIITDLKNGSYQISGLLENNANNDYTDIAVIVTGYDQNGTKIVENKDIIEEIKANSNSPYNVLLTPSGGKVVISFTVNILNATPN